MQRYLRECTALADKHYLAIATADQISSRLPPARPALVPCPHHPHSNTVHFLSQRRLQHPPHPQSRGHLHPHHWVRSSLPLATTGFFFLQPGSFLFLLFIWQVLVFLVWLKRDLSLLCGAFGQSQPI
jgi:hypothetical protein